MKSNIQISIDQLEKQQQQLRKVVRLTAKMLPVLEKTQTAISAEQLQQHRQSLKKTLRVTNKMLSILVKTQELEAVVFGGTLSSKDETKTASQLTLSEAIRCVLRNSAGWGKTCKEVIEAIQFHYPNNNYRIRSIGALLCQMAKQKKIKTLSISNGLMTYYMRDRSRLVQKNS